MVPNSSNAMHLSTHLKHGVDSLSPLGQALVRDRQSYYGRGFKDCDTQYKNALNILHFNLDNSPLTDEGFRHLVRTVLEDL